MHWRHWCTKKEWRNREEWHFFPGNAPWYNGTATKRALNAAVGDAVMTFCELQTCLFEAAELVNQRPIGILPNNPNDGRYLCPNDILLGRSSAIDTFSRNFHFKNTHNIIFLNEKLFKCNLNTSPLWSFCHLQNENILHLFFQCENTLYIWKKNKNIWINSTLICQIWQ